MNEVWTKIAMGTAMTLVGGWLLMLLFWDRWPVIYCALWRAYYWVKDRLAQACCAVRGVK